MRCRLLTPTGLRVPELFLGAMTFGEQGGVGALAADALTRLDAATRTDLGFPATFIRDNTAWVFGAAHQHPRAVSGLSSMSFALATRRATRPPAG